MAYEFAPSGGPVRFLAYVFSIGGMRFYHAGDGLVYRELPMHYDAIQGNTTAPGHFADLVREAGVSAAILIPALGHTFALSLP